MSGNVIYCSTINSALQQHSCQLCLCASKAEYSGLHIAMCDIYRRVTVFSSSCDAGGGSAGVSAKEGGGGQRPEARAESKPVERGLKWWESKQISTVHDPSKTQAASFSSITPRGYSVSGLRTGIVCFELLRRNVSLMLHRVYTKSTAC